VEEGVHGFHGLPRILVLKSHSFHKEGQGFPQNRSSGYTQSRKRVSEVSTCAPYTIAVAPIIASGKSTTPDCALISRAVQSAERICGKTASQFLEFCLHFRGMGPVPCPDFLRFFQPPIPGCRSKGKDSPPRRYFAGHLNSQPVAGRYVNGLCNAHEVSIPRKPPPGQGRGSLLPPSLLTPHSSLPNKGYCRSLKIIAY
jgi:hypothetical protein